MDFEKFKRIAEAVRHAIPTERRKLGGREYHDIMHAISDAGFPHRPHWDLVDALHDWVRATNPMGTLMSLDAAYVNYFGMPPEQEAKIEQVELAAAA